MLSDATLKLGVGIAVAAYVYFSYSKGKIKQEKLNKDIRIGRNMPFLKGDKISKYTDEKETAQKQGSLLKKSFVFI